MTDDRCDLTDIPRNMCGHCLGVGPTIGRIKPPPAPPEYPPGYSRRWHPGIPDTTPRDWHDGDRPPRGSTRCKRRTGDGLYMLPEHLDDCRDRKCNGCKPCTHDDNGNPTVHCEARGSCTEHLDADHPRTCPRCIAWVRADIAQVVRLSLLMLDQAIVTGVDSEAAMLAGPAANPGALTELREWLTWHDVLKLPEHDDRHPYTLLVRWEQQLAEHYGHPRPPAPTIASAASYLSWLLTDVAQTTDFAPLANGISRCRTHLEAVLGASRMPDRGAPCWECETPAPRLVLRRAHWCERPDCTREHDSTGARDTWVCPANRDHWWTEAEYRYATYAAAHQQGA
jgi:hypothetical protein